MNASFNAGVALVLVTFAVLCGFQVALVVYSTAGSVESIMRSFPAMVVVEAGA